ncbi:tryptophanyl-tRNA synthetase [Candidatus Endolissoclinum faulkneri L5]|uniref:Tryptophan--tRNA ligase n=1 Tax=Candidatus Endolissoclinum faulkneri L5 TaxID=1401328 RepID=V9TSZ1_9PROT|nr:tryptophan--tRNA ligase [Candidatus Endolissoclinum faulkneri]AHC73267.1 tryptophanyl-tRNA synthetase [Candidatus Endolissoclinum faulkneri L5]
MKRIFSGIQPTGNITLGNYLGAIQNCVKLQNEASCDCIFCVVDQHAITVRRNTGALKRSTQETAACLISAGIDPKNSILFNQSQVEEHIKLAWVLGCLTRVGWLNRMIQFKDKVGKSKDNASAGLWCYPILMAADILAYKATHVPVGDDQKQHIELARDIAHSYNFEFGTEFFPLPKAEILSKSFRIMSLCDGRKKMSKSDSSDMSRINITDNVDTIAYKIKKAKTDSYSLPSEASGLTGRAEAQNLITIYAALSNKSLDAAILEYGGCGFGRLKQDLTELAIEVIRPIGLEISRLMSNTDYIDNVLEKGSVRARALSKPIVREVYDTIGFLST